MTESLTTLKAIANHLTRKGGEVMIAMGRFNILVVCLFSELDRLYALASDQILVIDGVHHVETSIAVKTVKYNSRVVRIAEAERVVDADGG